VFDLNELNHKSVESIRAELAMNALILFRHQSLSDQAIIRLSRMLGNGRLEQSARRISLGACDSYVANLTNLHDELGQPLGYGGNHTDYWHSDQEFREQPASLGLLYCILPSLVGGETRFASTRATDLDLSPSECELLRNLRSTRRPADTHDNAPKLEISHRTLMENPITKKISAYVSENVREFIGLDRQEGNALKQRLMNAIVTDNNVYRHQWETGDLILYDNTQLVHRREAFSGPRWLKATKIYPVSTHFAVPQGQVVRILVPNA
jgi:taurine dioxygenase